MIGLSKKYLQKIQMNEPVNVDIRPLTPAA